MLVKSQLHDYQTFAVDHMHEHDDSMIWMGMGLGKTITTLTWIVDKIASGEIQKALIFGPVRVITTVWEAEARKWEHTKHLTFSTVHGTPEKRSRAMFANADIHLCNYENMNWLCEQLIHYYVDAGVPMPYQAVVYDEVSKCKNSTSLRIQGGNRDKTDGNDEDYQVYYHGWRKVINLFRYRAGLTGTPASNGYGDLHGQFLVVDGGERLGEYVTHFNDSYFAKGYMGKRGNVTTLGREFIEKNIADITVEMASRDYLDLPDVRVTTILVDLPPKARKAYDEMEADMYAALDSGEELEVFGRAAASNKCLQICNGNAYLDPETDEYTVIHNKKLDALEGVLEDAAGQPVLCSYTYKADAERIMKKFKKYRPVNLTAQPAHQTASILKKWNQGKIKLLIGHPACLHPSTEVLTERRGWVKLLDVKRDERVFDGVEFVSHSGCSYSGYKEVTDVFGITMTPNHKILIEDEWVEAADVRDTEEVRRKALYEYEGDDARVSEMLAMSNRVQDHSPECCEAQSTPTHSLPALCTGSLPQHDGHQDTPYLDGAETPLEGHGGYELRWSWYHHVPGLGRLYGFLQGYVQPLLGRSNDRALGCERTLLQNELHMGDDVRAARQQAYESQGDVPRRRYSFSRAGEAFGVQQNDVDDAIEPGHDRRRGSCQCEEVTLRQEHRHGERETTTIQRDHVYDLVDCGPRHRFVIRNDKGEVFISHNSMGHGIDGLQDSGNIIVWFGMPWAKELYDQMNARLDRQGQTQTVSIIRILCRDTVDLAVADSNERKTYDEEGLKDALNRFRKGITTNELKLSFL